MLNNIVGELEEGNAEEMNDSRWGEGGAVQLLCLEQPRRYRVACAQAYIHVGLLQLWHFSTAAKMEARDLERDAISLRQVQLEFP